MWHGQVRLAEQLRQSGLQAQELLAVLSLRGQPPEDASAAEVSVCCPAQAPAVTLSYA